MLLIKKGKISNDELSSIPFDFKLIDIDGYNIAISDEHVTYIIENNDVKIILGNAIYNSCFVTQDSLVDIFDDINISLSNTVNNLSGRFSLISVSRNGIKVLSSIFGSFPLYYSECGTYLSTIEPLISKFTNAKLSYDCLNIMIRYYARYNTHLYEGINRIEYGSLTTFAENVITKNYLSAIFSQSDYLNLTQDELVEILVSRLTNLLKIYSDNKLRVGLTGGRDSRLMLAMCKKLNIIDLENYTVGKKGDIESKYARLVSDFYGYSHEIFSPKQLNENTANNYFSIINNINFPSLYKWQLIEYLAQKPRKHINSATPETLLCHLDYFLGNEEPYANFVKNRASKVKQLIPTNKDIEQLTLSNAKKIWQKLHNNITSDVLTKLMFEQVSYQAEWVYNILKIGDYSGGTICIFEDPIILKVLSHIKESFFLNDNLYKYLVDTYYPEMNQISSTRDCDIGRVLKLSRFSVSFWKLLPDALKNDPLEYLVAENVDFIRSVIIDNKSQLTIFFGEEFLSDIINLTNNGFTYNRITRFLQRRINKKVLLNYQLIAPYCVASIIKNRS
ncbi:hypothetical protein AB7W46_13515 [Providencia rettgeri]